MISISYPAYDFRIRENNGKEFIFDPQRKTWVRLTPEEWVRQNMLQYLLQVKKYPASMIAVEREVMVGELRKRFDILIFRETKPWMIIECKEMNVPIGEAVLRQALNYNIGLQSSFLLITNGSETHGFSLRDGIALALDELPAFET